MLCGLRAESSRCKEVLNDSQVKYCLETQQRGVLELRMPGVLQRELVHRNRPLALSSAIVAVRTIGQSCNKTSRNRRPKVPKSAEIQACSHLLSSDVLAAYLRWWQLS